MEKSDIPQDIAIPEEKEQDDSGVCIKKEECSKEIHEPQELAVEEQETLNDGFDENDLVLDSTTSPSGKENLHNDQEFEDAEVETEENNDKPVREINLSELTAESNDNEPNGDASKKKKPKIQSLDEALKELDEPVPEVVSYNH